MISAANKRDFARANNSMLVIFLVCLACGCTTIPKQVPPEKSYAFELGLESRLTQLNQKISKEHGEDTSGFYILDRNDEAMRWRLLLLDLAQHSVDIQYFIWKGDAASVLLADRVLRAADRGVRIRVLVDDVSIMGGDRDIAAFNQHPYIEIRTFNPWIRRHGSKVLLGLEFMFHLKRLNHRMHNKLMVADNRVAIVGGRNIGNEYFGLNKKHNFIDLDVAAAGPVARDVSESFDIYWNSGWAYPGKGLAGDVADKDLLSELRKTLAERLDKAKKLLTSFPLERQTWDDQISLFADNLDPGTAEVVYDEPLIGEDMPPVQLTESLGEVAGDARKEVLISSPYFIPHEDFYKGLRELTQQGVRVKVITNSLASTNHPIVISAYRKHRKPFIQHGGELYELRDDAEIKSLYDTHPVRARFLGLHSKVIVVDRHRVFVGSLNLDPRSIYINTEMGLLIDSRELAEVIARLIERDMRPENSWRLRLDSDSQLIWESGDSAVRTQPARNSWQRFQSCFFSFLPIESQL